MTSSRNIVFYESPCELGLINEDTLAALINFNPVFKSHYAGMVATDNFNFTG